MPRRVRNYPAKGGKLRREFLAILIGDIPSKQKGTRSVWRVRLTQCRLVDIDGTRLTNPKAEVDVRDGAVLRVGKKRNDFRLERAP